MDTSARRVVLIVAWFFFLCSVGLFAVGAAPLADRRAQDLTPRAHLLTGPRAALPYALPLVLLPVGLAVYRGVFGPTRIRAGNTPEGWRRAQTAFLAMMGVFEINILAGLTLFLLGESFPLFFLFAGTTLVLFGVGIWRLLTTWPLD